LALITLENQKPGLLLPYGLVPFTIGIAAWLGARLPDN